MNRLSWSAQATGSALQQPASSLRRPHQPHRSPSSHRSSQPPEDHQQSARRGSITEIVLPDNNPDQIPLLMPLLAQLSRDDRWFIWVSPPTALPAEQLRTAGIDLNKVLLLNPDSQNSVCKLACKALAAGTAHVAVSWPGYLSQAQLHQLEHAARSGNSQGIILRRRQDA